MTCQLHLTEVADKEETMTGQVHEIDNQEHEEARGLAEERPRCDLNETGADQRMNIVITGGGTAGHIYPALALADELKQKGHHIYYAGTPKGTESTLVPRAGYDFVSFDVSGFDRSRPWTAITALNKARRCEKQAERWLKEVDAKLVVGFGGYVSVPVVRAAQKIGVKTAIHEQNSAMGLANEELAKHADLVCLTYECAAQKVKDKSKVVLTGNPVRKEVLSATREDGRRAFGIDEKSLVLLVFGGSLGAKTINEAIVDLKEELLAKENLQIIHVTGKRDYEWVKDKLALTNSNEERYHLIDYCYNMPEALAACDVIVSRAGATSLAEISSLAIPALLIPFPFATADHQTKNAKSYVEAGAAHQLSDEEAKTDAFKEKLFDLIENEGTRQRMRKSAEAFETQNASLKLAQSVLQLLE